MVTVNKKQPRGIRNNNAGNIRASGDWQAWKGAVDSDNKGFIIFDTPINGIRALARTLRTYRNNYGLNSVKEIINRWAPPIENDTTSYVESVAQKVGIGRNETLLESDYTALIEAIVYHENGVQPYSEQLIQQGFEMGFYA